jgi:hypothetical protein
MARWQVVYLPAPSYVMSEHSSRRKAFCHLLKQANRMIPDCAEVYRAEVDVQRRRKSTSIQTYRMYSKNKEFKEAKLFSNGQIPVISHSCYKKDNPGWELRTNNE